MKLAELVTEVLNSRNLDIKQTSNDRDMQRWILNLGERQIRFVAKWHGKDVMDFYFLDNESGYELSGKGDELKVFAAAKQILLDIIKERDPAVINFEADKKSGNNRARLYKKFLDRWTPPGYRFKELTDDYSSNFYIQKEKS